MYLIKLLKKKKTTDTIKRVDEFLCTPDYEVTKDDTYEKVSGTYLDSFRKAKYDFLKYTEIDLGKSQSGDRRRYIKYFAGRRKDCQSYR